MKKEVIFAILVGFTIGLIITFGIYSAQQSYQNSQESIQASNLPDQNHQANTPTFPDLQITQPETESVYTQSPIQIRGITSPNSYVTATSYDHHTFSQAAQTGSFGLELELEPGANIITVTSLNDQTPQKQQTLIITLLESNPDLPDNKSQEQNEE